METLHNTRNCKYRKFLHTKLKHGKISGKFYKFLYRNFPYRLTARSVSTLVGEVLHGRITEEKAIFILQKHDNEFRRQKEMMQSNWECKKKTSKTTTPYTKPLKNKYE